jgi:ABC-2 type transport system ATP-binding protein
MNIQRVTVPAVQLRGLGKVYRVHERASGVGAAMKSLFRREWKHIPAVQDLTFDLAQGEMVGFLGPNGAGKTTTIKMLSGLLYPSAGEVLVLGRIPWERKRDFLKRITLIMGRRNQLVWDVPAIDTFDFFHVIYDVPDAQFKRIFDELVDLLELGPLMHKPVRNLSLGERMKCELTASLLHRPEVLFLDEPTIGLDVLAQHRFRQYIAEYNRRYEATVLLTSHYMGDVEALCRRVIFIDQGKLLFDGSLEALVERFLPYKTVQVRIKPGSPEVDFSGYGEVVASERGMVTLRVTKESAPRVVSRLLSEISVQDIDVANPPATEVVKYIYANKAEMAAAV